MERTTDNTRRSTGGVPSPPAVAGVYRRDRILIATCIAGVTAVAWAYLVHLDRRMSASAESTSMMAAMGMTLDAPWGAADIVLTFIMWAVMMVGMMSASAAPVLLLFAEMQARRTQRGLTLTLLFALGYLSIWFGFSATAALTQWGLHQAALMSPAMATSSPRLAGAILIAAGGYQLTPAKGACLRHCQSPLGFLLSHWRDGAKGALGMGLRHGVYCVGCCWAMMAVLFAVGVMNLAWVGALTAFILLEKIGHTGMRAARVGGTVIVALGILFVTGWHG